MLKLEEIDDAESCWNKAKDGERVFVLLARDEAAPFAIRCWAHERIRLGKNKIDDSQIVEALDCATNMERERNVGIETVDRLRSLVGDDD